MFDRVIEHLYLKVFVNIVVYDLKTFIYIEVVNKKGLLEDIFKKSFDSVKLNHNIYDFIFGYISKTPFYYISVLDGSIAHKITKDLTCMEDKNLKCIAHKNQFAFCTDRSDIDMLQKRYKKIGVDFIFSPFAVLSNLFEEQIKKEMVLLVLIEDGFCTVEIFDKSRLLYAKRNKIKLDDEVFLSVENEIKHFYKDTQCDSRFIQMVYIADSVGVGKDLKESLEEEMFFDVFLYDVVLNSEVCKLAKAELDEI